MRWWLVVFGVVVAGVAGAQDSTSKRMAHARTLALSAHYAQSIAVYDSLLAIDPHDFEAALARAQVVAWSGRLGEAEQSYRALVAAGAGGDADKGLARTLAWRAHLAESDSIYRAVVARDSNDTEAWTGLAQVLQWEGRPRQAMAAIERGLAAHPDDGDARALWRTLRPIVSPSVRPTFASGGDTEHNTNVSTTVAADALAPWDGRTSVTAGFTDAWRGLANGTSSVVRVGASWAVAGDRLALSAAGGVATTNGVDPLSRTVTTGTGNARLSSQLAPALALGLTVYAAPFDETAALIANGIRQASAGADVAVTPAGVGGVRVEASGAYVGVGGAARGDDRVEGSVYLWSGAWHHLSIGAGSHGYGYLRDDTIDGYFTPASFILGEGAARWATDREGWNGSAEVGAGAQRIAAFGAPGSTHPAYRVQASVTYRVAPGVEYGVSGGYALAASPEATSAQAASNYRGYSVAVTARVIP